MNVSSNGGTLVVTKKANVPGYNHRVHYSERAITNILSLKNVRKQYHVTYDSYNDQGFVVHRQEHGLPDMHFTEHESGLHIYYPYEEGKVFVLETVAGNMEGFTKKEIKQAKAARRLYNNLKFPSEADFNIRGGPFL